MSEGKIRGLRGSALEELINMTNEQYKEQGIALMQKVPTPITPVTIDQETRHITLAYFQQKSTVDYIGAVQGLPVCFDAKECSYDTFSLQNIHPHQIDFMERFEAQGGISFLIIDYTHLDRIFYMPFRDVKKFWDRGQNGGRKSFRFEEVDQTLEIHPRGGFTIPYLDMLQEDLNRRDEMEELK